ncbi:hypothetical protein LY624_02110 [Pseudoalteromonas sp. N1230-9]|nr:hypothetical protein LY624_02110 [Pseudoalteromonas sp. N1230-9]
MKQLTQSLLSKIAVSYLLTTSICNAKSAVWQVSKGYVITQLSADEE